MSDHVAGSIWVKLGLDSSAFSQGLANAKTSLINWRDTTNANTMDLAKWGAAISRTAAPIAAVALAVGSGVKTAIAYEEQMKKISLATGMSITTAQRWKEVTDSQGVSFTDFSTTLQQLSLRIGESGEAGDKLRSRLEAIGVSVKDNNGNFRSASAVMQDLLPALSKVTDITERNALANETLGRSWYTIAPMIANGTKVVKEFNAAMPGFSESDMAKVDKFRMKWEQFNSELEKVYVNVGLVAIGMAMPDTSSKSMTMGGTESKAGPGSSVDILGGRFGYLPDARKSKIVPAGYGVNPYSGLSDEQLALKELQDIQIPELTSAFEKAQMDGATADVEKYGLALAKAGNQVQQLKDQIAGLSTAQADYRSKIAAYTSSAEGLNTINKTFSRELSIADPRDVGGIRDLMIRHKWAVEDQQESIDTAKGDAMSSARKYNAASEAAGKGSVIINIDGKKLLELAGVSFDKNLNESMRSAGVSVY